MRGRLLFWLGPPRVIVLPIPPARAHTHRATRPWRRSALPADLGAELRDARLRAGLTLAELAQRAHLSRALLSRLENGHRAPSVPAVLRLAAALDLSDDLEHRLLIYAATSGRPVHSLWVVPPRPVWPRLARRWHSRINRVAWLLRRPIDMGLRRLVVFLQQPWRPLLIRREQGKERSIR